MARVRPGGRRISRYSGRRGLTALLALVAALLLSALLALLTALLVLLATLLTLLALLAALLALLALLPALLILLPALLALLALLTALLASLVLHSHDALHMVVWEGRLAIPTSGGATPVPLAPSSTKPI
ncbi:hypothetical protein [Cupriavidus sp.]|uniref:hypothetical protein n=1 Tax=Cupriavidus sp. TaxID=1873897 RepID=UPI0025C68CEC|nr:hypothetical protein [Cupriavidus sp.]MCA3186211.1 hypothetical protein [Cupriavidus sp.]MCA3231806.1 hypothetical protein [Cupriavidus sp.]